MDATTMLSMNLLLEQIRKDFPAYQFKTDDTFWWSPDEQIIHYDPTDKDASLLLLHELAHADLGHESYDRDIDLIKREREAWEHAVSVLSCRYEAAIPETIVESSLDTYRDWLHDRSTCPTCSATGIQTKKYRYQCLACATEWRVNEARSCALRRYKETK